MQPTLHTKRFTLYPWNQEAKHTKHLIEMMQDEAIQRYVFDHALSDEEVEQTLERMVKSNQAKGLGYWFIYDGDICVGMTLLKRLPNEENLDYNETGYWIKPPFWGKGIAAEVATRIVKYGFEQLKLPLIAGVTHKDNIASQKSLEKAGLRRHGHINTYGQNLPFFKIEIADFQAKTTP